MTSACPRPPRGQDGCRAVVKVTRQKLRLHWSENRGAGSSAKYSSPQHRTQPDKPKISGRCHGARSVIMSCLATLRPRRLCCLSACEDTNLATECSSSKLRLSGVWGDRVRVFTPTNHSSDTHFLKRSDISSRSLCLYSVFYQLIFELLDISICIFYSN